MPHLWHSFEARSSKVFISFVSTSCTRLWEKRLGSEKKKSGSVMWISWLRGSLFSSLYTIITGSPWEYMIRRSPSGSFLSSLSSLSSYQILELVALHTDNFMHFGVASPSGNSSMEIFDHLFSTFLLGISYNRLAKFYCKFILLCSNSTAQILNPFSIACQIFGFFTHSGIVITVIFLQSPKGFTFLPMVI